MSELQVHRAVLEYLRLVLRDAEIFHCPNGEVRDKRIAAKLKFMGVMRGVADLIVLLPGGRTLFVECKAPGGRVSADQVWFAGRVRALGHHYCVVRSIDETRLALAALCIPVREKVAA